MKTTLLALVVALAACNTTKQHRNAPSVGAVKSSIAQAGGAANETSRKLSEIKTGTNRVDYKAARALEYFQ